MAVGVAGLAGASRQGRRGRWAAYGGSQIGRRPIPFGSTKSRKPPSGRLDTDLVEPKGIEPSTSRVRLLLVSTFECTGVQSGPRQSTCKSNLTACYRLHSAQRLPLRVFERLRDGSSLRVSSGCQISLLAAPLARLRTGQGSTRPAALRAALGAPAARRGVSARPRLRPLRGSRRMRAATWGRRARRRSSPPQTPSPMSPPRPSRWSSRRAALCRSDPGGELHSEEKSPAGGRARSGNKFTPTLPRLPPAGKGESVADDTPERRSLEELGIELVRIEGFGPFAEYHFRNASPTVPFRNGQFQSAPGIPERADIPIGELDLDSRLPERDNEQPGFDMQAALDSPERCFSLAAGQRWMPRASLRPVTLGVSLCFFVPSQTSGIASWKAQTAVDVGFRPMQWQSLAFDAGVQARAGCGLGTRERYAVTGKAVHEGGAKSEGGRKVDRGAVRRTFSAEREKDSSVKRSEVIACTARKMACSTRTVERHCRDLWQPRPRRTPKP